jgi:hypothetical protein
LAKLASDGAQMGSDPPGLTPATADEIHAMFDASSKALDRTAHWVDKELGVKEAG